MSFVVVTPQALAASATQLQDIGSALGGAGGAAAASITRLTAASQDEVSVAIAAVFSDYGLAYEWLSVEMARYFAHFVQAAKFAAEAYQVAETQLAAWLAAQRASRTASSSPQPNLNDTNPAGGGA